MYLPLLEYLALIVSHGSGTELDVLHGVISGLMRVGLRTSKGCLLGRQRVKPLDNCTFFLYTSIGLTLITRSFLIGRKGLKEDLARFEEEGNQRFQKLVTEYAEHEVC